MNLPARRLTVLLGFAATLFVLPASPASAHTELTGSFPADKAKVAAPSAVSLAFNESIRPGLVTVNVADAGGEKWQAGKAKVDQGTVSQPMKPDMAPGKYTVSYRVVSEDGHPVSGSLTFTVTGDLTVTSKVTATPTITLAAKQEETTGGGGRWLMVGAGLAAGAGVGLMIAMRKRRA